MRYEGEFLMRMAERTPAGSLTQLPPRSTRREQSPANHTVPSAGAPLYESFQQSSTHSHALPSMSYRPNALGLKEPTGAV